MAYRAAASARTRSSHLRMVAVSVLIVSRFAFYRFTVFALCEPIRSFGKAVLRFGGRAKRSPCAAGSPSSAEGGIFSLSARLPGPRPTRLQTPFGAPSGALRAPCAPSESKTGARKAFAPLVVSPDLRLPVACDPLSPPAPPVIRAAAQERRGLEYRLSGTRKQPRRFLIVV